MSEALTVKEFTSETWADFEALFGKHKGVSGGCWCVFHLCPSSEFNAMTREGRRDFQQRQVELGCGSGLLVYDQGVPVAWCQFGAAERFRQIERMRAYQALNLPAELRPRWRISCIFVDKHRRREGWSQFALHAAVGLIREHGGGLVESFPLDLPGPRPPYTGSEAMYLREGFETITRLGKNTLLMRLLA